MAPITVVALSTSFWGSKLSLPTGTCTRLVLSARNSTLPALISFTAAATSRVTVPVLGLGADVPLPHRRPDPLPLARGTGVAPGPTGDTRPRPGRPRTAASRPPLRLHREAPPGPHRLPRLLGALIGTQGIDDTLGAIGHHLHTYEIVSHTAFAERVARRRTELELR